MQKHKVFIYIFLPILLILSGWEFFNQYIRPHHYQLLYPYSTFQFKYAHISQNRIGKDKRIQIFIPEGDAIVGKEDYEENILIESYWIDQIPVTVSDYKNFLTQSNNLAPRYRDEFSKYWWEKQYELLPVVFVSWGQAENYCEFYGGHLPTEAQWEKASRGPAGIVLYWNDDEKAYNKANYDNFFDGSTFSGWQPAGKTIYGILDMAGNVREWVLDWMNEPYQKVSQDAWLHLKNQKPYQSDSGRILKGGSFVDDLSHLRLNYRDAHDPNSPGLNRGFRCVYDK